MRALLIALLAAAGCSLVSAAEKKSFEDDLLDAIDRIAVQQGISKEEAMQKAHSLMNDAHYWPVKGGVAVIRDEMYVLANSKNGIIVGGETVLGADWNSPELYVFAGKKLVGRLSIPKGTEGDVVLALFTPEKIRIFDWKKLSGGFYLRRHE